VPITLTARQLTLALSLAKRRNEKELRFGARTYGEVQGGLKAHEIGLVAEVAVAVYFGVQVDDTILERGDDGIDLVLPEPYGVCGVKATTYPDDPLLRVEQEHLCDKVDSYILVYVREDLAQVSLIGWATRGEVKTGMIKQFVPGGPVNYVLYETELHQVKERSDDLGMTN
jgi:hypothetical protein